VDEKRHGKGTFQFPDGARYEGEFKKGQCEGLGPTLLRMEDITLEAWSRGVMKDLEVRYAYVVTLFDSRSWLVCFCYRYVCARTLTLISLRCCAAHQHS
jgi:MORN repeat